MKRKLLMAAAASAVLAMFPSQGFAAPGDAGDFSGAKGVSKGTEKGYDGAGATCAGCSGSAGIMMLNAPTVQSFAFSNGTDTNQMQYSASAGQSNSFSVGANNSAGINSSVQSTAEYNGSSNASLTLAAGCTKGCEQSVLTNVIGVAESSYNNASKASAYSAAAEASASAAVGASYEEYRGRQGNSAKTEADYKAAYKASYDVSYAAAASSSSNSASGVQNQSGVVGGTFSSTTTGQSTSGTTGSGTMTSSSEVTLTGIGAKSTVAAGADSTFETNIQRNTGVTGTADMASAQAGAGLSLGTNASASSNASSFSSVFVSAF